MVNPFRLVLMMVITMQSDHGIIRLLVVLGLFVIHHDKLLLMDRFHAVMETAKTAFAGRLMNNHDFISNLKLISNSVKTHSKQN